MTTRGLSIAGVGLWMGVVVGLAGLACGCKRRDKGSGQASAEGGAAKGASTVATSAMGASGRRASGAMRMPPARTGVTPTPAMKPRRPVALLAKSPNDPAAVGCGRDEDCLITKLKDGDCCTGMCGTERHAYRREFVPKLKAHQMKICAAHRPCGYSFCDGFSGRDRPFCRGGRCAAYFDLALGTMFKIPPDQKDKWTCERDVDCLRSCSHGAVAKAWYAKQRARIRECKGGCAGSKSAAPRCVEGRCVAFDRQGNWYPACSARKGTLTKVP